MKYKSLFRDAIVILLAVGLYSCKKDKEEESVPATIVTTLAGNGIEGWADGNSATAEFDHPFDIAMDGQGAIFTSDIKNYCIRRIAPDGTVTTLAGGTHGTADGTGASAQFMDPRDMVADKQGNLYVADGSRIRKITPAGTVTTFAGSLTTGNADGTGTAAQFHNVGSMAMNSVGVLYIVDHDYSNIRTKIRKISPSSEVTTFIDSTTLFGLGQIIADSDDNLLAVFGGLFSQASIEKITSSKNITPIAKIISPGGIARSPLGKIYFTASTSDFNNTHSWSKIYQVGSNGNYVAIAGDEIGFADGGGATAKFFSPKGIVVGADGTIYVADTGNNRIRKITVH